MANLYIEWSGVNNNVVDGYEIHMSNVSGFDPDSSTRIGTTLPDVNVFEQEVPDGTFFYRVVGYNDYMDNSTPEIELSADCGIGVSFGTVVAVVRVRR